MTEDSERFPPGRVPSERLERVGSDRYPVVENDSGLYRAFTSKMFPVIMLVLWGLLTVLAGMLWNDVQAAKERINILQTQRTSDYQSVVESREAVNQDIREMKADIKEILREARR